MSLYEDLTAVADLLERPGAWTQYATAKTKKGNPVPGTSRSAVCWCLDGAAHRIGRRHGDVYLALVDALEYQSLIERDDEDYIEWNDEDRRTQEEVVAFVRRTAERVKREDGE